MEHRCPGITSTDSLLEMNFTYDQSSNAAYLQLIEVEDDAGIVAETLPLTEDIIVDYDSDGGIFGIEFLNASTHLPDALLSESSERRKRSA